MKGSGLSDLDRKLDLRAERRAILRARLLGVLPWVGVVWGAILVWKAIVSPTLVGMAAATGRLAAGGTGVLLALLGAGTLAANRFLSWTLRLLLDFQYASLTEPQVHEPADPRGLPAPDRDWYERSGGRLEELGFRPLGDIRIQNLPQAGIHPVPITRLMVGPAGEVASFFRVPEALKVGRLPVRVRGGAAVGGVMLRTELTDGSLVQTRDGEAPWQSPASFVVRVSVEVDTPLEQIVDRHRRAVEERLRSHSELGPVLVSTLAEALAANERIRQGLCAERQAVGWMTRAEFDRLARGPRWLRAAQWRTVLDWRRGHPPAPPPPRHRFHHGDASLEMSDEPTYEWGSLGRGNGSWDVELRLGDGTTNSCHGLVYQSADGRRRIIIGADGAGTTVHERSVVLLPDRCFVAVGGRVACLTLPQLALVWNVEADEASCFGLIVGPGEGYLIVHGELAISRLSLAGEVVWRHSGRDVFNVPLVLQDDHLEATDFEGTKYVIDLVTGRDWEPGASRTLPAADE